MLAVHHATTKCWAVRPSCASVLPSSRHNWPSSRRSAPNCRMTEFSSTRSRKSDLRHGLRYPYTDPARFFRPGIRTTSLGAQHARPDVPVLSINGDGGFLYTGNELATAIRHGIPLVAIVFVDGAYGNVRRIQQEDFGNRLIACDLANPDFVKYAESFGAAGRRARGPDELRKILRESFARREPTLIEVPVGAMPSPWEFILMPRVRGP